jgi:hypothetical protein
MQDLFFFFKQKFIDKGRNTCGTSAHIQKVTRSNTSRQRQQSKGHDHQ